jgi:hypothetical protein
MTDRPQIHLHIGAHKTASTFLASMLRNCEEGLAQQGLGVVFRDTVFKTPFALEVLEVAHGTRPSGEVTKRARKSIRTLLAQFEGDVLILNEDLVCRLGVKDFYQNIASAVRHIHATLPDQALHFILYVRRQPDYLESVYMQHVHLGRPLKFERFMERAGTVDLSWLRVVDDLARAAGAENVIVRPFETIREGEDRFLRDFLRVCGVPNPESFSATATAGGRAANRSYSGLAMKIARRANPLLETKKDRRMLRRFLQENFSTATHPRAELLDAEARTAVVARYAPSNRELFRRYDLGADGAALGYY